LRPFFLAKGCDLYVDRISRGLNPRTASPPAINRFGLFGDRDNFDSKPPLFSTVRHSMFVYIEEISHLKFLKNMPLERPDLGRVRYVSVDNIPHNGLSITFSLFARKNRDVVIKAVSYGSAQTNELQILRYLNSDLLRSDKTKNNATVPVIEFIEHSG
jgi:hypothetical protein